MAQRAALSLNDSTATARTFNPVLTSDQNAVEWVARHPADAVGFCRIRMQWMPGKKAPPSPEGANPRVLHKCKWTVTVPIVDTTAPNSGSGVQPTKSYNGEVKYEFVQYLPQHAPALNRADGLAYARALMAHVLMADVGNDFNPPW